MNIHPKKFALFGNVYQAKKSAHVLRLLSILASHQAEIYIHKEFYQFLVKDQKMDIQATGIFEDASFDVDMVLSMGGDGTFLKAASYVGNKHIPILGINTGRLGFLADVSPEEMEETFFWMTQDEREYPDEDWEWRAREMKLRDTTYIVMEVTAIGTVCC